MRVPQSASREEFSKDSTGGVFGKRGDPREHARSVAKNSQTQKHIARLEALMQHEGDLRDVKTVRELRYFIANETRRCITARQVFVLRLKEGRKIHCRIESASNLSELDRNAPAVRWLEAGFSKVLAGREKGDGDAAQQRSFVLQTAADDDTAVFPFPHGVLVPLLDHRQKPFAAIALLAEQPLPGEEQPVLMRLQAAWRHAWLALDRRPGGRVGSSFWRVSALVFSAMLIAAMFIPVPMTALGPVEIVARSPRVVAAPIDGVIDNIEIAPNTSVEAGTLLFRYIDTDLAARMSLAERNRDVAAARLRTARQDAFGSGQGRRDLAVARSELQLAETELLYARAQLQRTIVRAPAAGIAVFDRKADWQGRPVSVGEKIIEIADPGHIEFRVDLPVSDAIVLMPDARVKIFLDSDPLNPLEASLHSSAYQAKLSAADILSFKIFARHQPPDGNEAKRENLRIGARGTAQVFGAKVSLGFYLFRRPLSVIRRYTGW